MQHYQTAGFSKRSLDSWQPLEDPQQTVYGDRWLRFAHWALWSKPPYVLLREASLKHLTFKTVFLLAMASAGRSSELQALLFDLQYIQIKPIGSGVALNFNNQRPNQVNDPWYIPGSRLVSQNLVALTAQ